MSKLGEGHPEPEANVVPEVNLHDAVTCEKNPGHKGFIPLDTFCWEHLPPDYRQPWREKHVRTVADLTVRIKATLASCDRPSTYPGTDRDYPFYNPNGHRKSRTGTGVVKNVVRHGEGGNSWYRNKNIRCPCREDKSCEARTWWCVSIITCMHVLYNQSEIEDAEILFFFDSGSERNPDLIKVNGFKLLNNNFNADRCQFQAILHEKKVGERLETAMKYVNTTHNQHRSYSRGIQKFSGNIKDDLVIVVSHPHGTSKQISIGHLCTDGDVERMREKEGKREGEGVTNGDRQREGETNGEGEAVTNGDGQRDGKAGADKVMPVERGFYDPIMYTTPTCPGSSGGLVLIGSGGKVVDPMTREVKVWSKCGYSHSEAMPNGINKSGGRHWH